MTQVSTTKSYPSSRKSPVRLTNREEYKIYTYCVENHCISQDGEYIAWRVDKAKISKEINILNMFEGRAVTSHHIASAVENVVEWQGMMEKFPAMPLETVEMEQLKIQHKKDITELEKHKLAIDAQKNELKLCYEEIERLKKSDAHAKIARIRAIVSV